MFFYGPEAAEPSYDQIPQLSQERPMYLYDNGFPQNNTVLPGQHDYFQKHIHHTRDVIELGGDWGGGVSGQCAPSTFPQKPIKTIGFLGVLVVFG